MLTNNKKPTINLKKTIFKSECLSIYEEIEDVYSFDIDNKLYTVDIIEAVTYLIKNKKYDNSKILDLELKENMAHYISPANSLYLLSGGEEFWNEISYNWVDNYELYEKRFQKKLYEIFNQSYNIRELKYNIMKHFNLDVFYDFLLLTNMKREKY